MPWNYRLCKEKVRDDVGGEPVYYYSVREAFFNQDGSIWAIGGEASLGCDKYATDTEEWVKSDLQQDLEHQRQAFSRAVIDLDTIVYAAQEQVVDL